MGAPRVRALAATALALALLVLWTSRITTRPVEYDAAQTVLMALNLDHHGVMSLDESPPYTPTDYREPVPVLASAFGIRLIDLALGTGPPESYLQGERVKALKYQNLIWLALLSLGAFWAARALGASFGLALLAVVLVNLPFIGRDPSRPVDNLLTEIPAAAVLLWASLALALAVRGRWTWILGAGVLFGILTLIKAATLYVFIVLALIWPVARWWSATPGLRRLAAEWGALALSFAVMVLPWAVRNHSQVGSFEISQRAGAVLMMRALHDQMTSREYVGGIYLWSPPALQGMLGAALGFSPSDLQRGGQLERLNDGPSDFAAADRAAEDAGRPDRAISYYRQARAQRVQLETMLSEAHRPSPDAEADELLTKRARAIIGAHPWRHLALTPLFLWRGAATTFPVLIAGLVLALMQRRPELLLFVTPALGLIGLYALGTHFVPRYDAPSHAVAAVVVVLLARAIGESIARGRAPTTAALGS